MGKRVQNEVPYTPLKLNSFTGLTGKALLPMVLELV
jgi:hypothetical protein